MSSPRKETIFDPLTEKEKQFVAYMEDAVVNKNEVILEKMKTWFLAYPPILVFRLTNTNKYLTEFCRSHPELNAKWKNILSEGKYPSIEITPLDGSIKISVYDLFIGASIYSAYIDFSSRDPEGRNALNQSCEKGLYNAFIARCKINQTIIKNAKITDPKLDIAVDAVLQDVKSLSSLYWGLGYFQGACFLHTIAGYFSTKAESELENGNVDNAKLCRDRGVSFLENAVKYYLCASSLRSSDHSNEIIDCLTNGQGLASIVDGGLKFTNWETAKSTMQSWIGDNYVIQEKAAAKEITTYMTRIQDKEAGETLFTDLSNAINNLTLEDIAVDVMASLKVSKETEIAFFKAYQEVTKSEDEEAKKSKGKAIGKF